MTIVCCKFYSFATLAGSKQLSEHLFPFTPFDHIQKLEKDARCVRWHNSNKPKRPRNLAARTLLVLVATLANRSHISRFHSLLSRLEGVQNLILEALCLCLGSAVPDWRKRPARCVRWQDAGDSEDAEDAGDAGDAVA